MQGSKIPVLSNACTPDYLLSANPQLVADAQYDDFDVQAERLVGYDQTYLQLTPGPFHGRFLSCFLGGDISIHIEHCNQALEQTVVSHPQAFTIGVTVDGAGDFRSNGRPFGAADVMITPPRSDLHLLSPLNGAVLVVVVREERLLRIAGMSDRLQAWFADARREVRLLRLPRLARRIREDVVLAVESAGRADCTAASATTIGEALVAGLLFRLVLEVSAGPHHGDLAEKAAYERYMECRRAILSAWDAIHDTDRLVARTGINRRSMQESFRSQVALGPLTYHRIVRLHLVKRALLDPAQARSSIGDIAAMHGFWSWSQFSQLYRNHFGELPSRTRSAGLSSGR